MMATGREPRRANALPNRVREHIIGEYSIHRQGGNKVLTLGVDLERTEFPTELGTELDVRYVEPADDDEQGHLEVHPS
jgi:hypothetical protein